MDLEENPYAASWTPLERTKSPRSESRSGAESARDVFLAWERLRLLFNVILVVESLFLGMPHLPDGGFWAFLVVSAIMANVCFCAGACAEGYLSLLGFRREAARYIVFAVGTSLSMFLAMALIWTVTVPD
jgi:hypothetical protein